MTLNTTTTGALENPERGDYVCMRCEPNAYFKTYEELRNHKYTIHANGYQSSVDVNK